MPIEAIVMPTWQAEMYSSMWSSWSQRQPRAPRRPPRHLLEPRPARAHERVLRDHEERVDHDQDGREDELQRVHCARASHLAGAVRPAIGSSAAPAGARCPRALELLLRGRASSSFIACDAHER